MKHHYIAIENAATSSSVALLRADRDGSISVIGRQHEAAQQHAEHILPMLDSLLDEWQLAKKDIHGVVFSQGPGAFTGLRIACGVAQGLALGLGLEVVAVDSLRATASMVSQPQQYGLIVALLDARMQETYMAVYRPVALSTASSMLGAGVDSALMGSTKFESVQDPVLIAVEDVLPWLLSQSASWRNTDGLSSQEPFILHLCGNALDEYKDIFSQGQESLARRWREAGVQISLGHRNWPNAQVLVQLGYTEFKQGRAMLPERVAPLYLRDKVAFTTSEREQGMGGNPKANLPERQGQRQESMDTSQQLLVALQAKGVSIRAMQQDDIEAVLAIEHGVQSHPWTAGMFADSLRSNYAAWVVCQADGNVIAYALQMFAPDVAHLLNIAVSPDWQRQGFGQDLLQWSEQKVKESGLFSQMLEVRASNTAAQALYTHANYQQIGLRKGYYRGLNGQSEDALVLQKMMV